ncbi:toll/interleukin-1 receptor domain-containing protein [Methanoplanus limicola]|uniref:TIR protein n=1 Tax=Methanoplanus limicola DSM 2279 TaxID=937775 RepID=H1Z307_9EURY|nr:toll/interleukin-1 receptor domain-containing protein [Methanoplanus limicola]EHQ35547.1 TIR protein [Methanoplanus limicola DSM 2279]
MQTSKLKLFISYSHVDNLNEPYIDNFYNYISPFEKNGLIEIWYDKKISPGDDFQNIIDSNLETSDIICQFISKDFLISNSCISEKNKAIELKNKKNVKILPIILSTCLWKEDNEISKLLALPTDGKPVTDFEDQTKAWDNVSTRLKEIINIENYIRNVKVKDNFKDFLNNAEMLTKAHRNKEEVYLNDIYIHTELEEFDRLKDYCDTINSKDILDVLLKEEKITISGEGQSGKTTLCKKIYCELRKLNYVPVYISFKSSTFLGEKLTGKTSNIIFKLLKKQYINIELEKINQNRIVPIIDDFHYTNNKEKHLKEFLKYRLCTIVIDDIFSLNINDVALTSSFKSYRIKELKPSLRNELIKKWNRLTDKNGKTDYFDIDRNTDLINTTLGKNLGKGIMPAYPFFILSTIMTYETYMVPLDQEITSQGYCYQAFITFYLRNRDVKNDEIDIYINYLTEFASYIFESKKDYLDKNEFSKFRTEYSDKYNLPINEKELLENLTDIITKSSFNSYSFTYPYLFYFFVAKSISENPELAKEKKTISKILKNLHVNENAYIAIFLTHHSRNNEIFKEIEDISSSLFNRYKPAKLTKDETSFIDEQAHNIINAILPHNNATPEKNRTQKLSFEDELEQSNEEYQEFTKEGEDEIANDLSKDLRRAIKTVEVIGCIIRNRSGSIEKMKLHNLFLEGMNVHLRILSSFCELIREEDNQKYTIEIISERLNKLDENLPPHHKKSEEEKRKIANKIFWNLDFFIIYGIIDKIIQSLGCDKIIEISNNVCDEINNPASFLIKHGITIRYNKELQINELSKKIDDKDFSEVARKITNFMIVEYCSLNPINYRDRQKIKTKLKIPDNKIKRNISKIKKYNG